MSGSLAMAAPSSGMPPLPPGFSLDGAAQAPAPGAAQSAQPVPAQPAVPPLPAGFKIDAAPEMDPTGYPVAPDAPQQPAAPAQPDGFFARADNLARSAFNSATFGAGKYIDAAETAVEQPLFHGGSSAPSFSQRYSDDLDSEKARLASVPAIAQLAVGLPAGFATGAGVGAIGKAALAGARFIPGANALLGAASDAAAPVMNLLARVPGASMAAPVVKSAATGAAYGAAQGFGDTDGGFQNRLAGAQQGAAVGAVAGPIVEGSVNALANLGQAASGYLSRAGYGAKNALLDTAGQPIIGSSGQPIAATAGVAQQAGQQIAGAAHDLPAVQAALANPSGLVPGSQPTTFQLTGDAGLGQKELALRNTPGAAGTPGPSTAFMDRANQQNAARVGAISGLVPADASSTNLINSLEAQRDTLGAQRDAAVQSVQQQVAQAVDALGNVPTGDQRTALQQLGQTLRAPMVAGDQAAKANVTRLADAIDPDGTLGVDMRPVRDQAKAVLGSIGPNAAQPTGAEASILQTAAALPDTQSFRDLADLRQQITDTIRGARPNPERAQEVRRLSMLLDGVHDTMAGVVNDPAVSVAAAAPATASPVAAPNVGSDVFTPSGQRVGVQYQVANAPDLIASHNADMTPNPAFPAELQPRARDRAASQVQVANIAANLQPERLGASSTVTDGAPIVGPDGVVESGNGRVMALRRAYDANGPQAQAYRDWLASQGHDTAGIDQPVLIRRRVTDLTPDQRVNFAAEGNAPTTLAMSAPEQAAGDARHLSSDLLDQVQPGDVADPANRDFVRSFARNVVDPAQSGSFAAADGSLSQQGAARVRAALVHRAYGDTGLSAALAESTDPTAKVLAGAMQDAAGPMARLKAGIEAGHVDPAVDLAPSLVEAAQAVQQARQRGLSLADHVGQADAFNRMSPQAERLLQAAYGPGLVGRMSRGDFADMLGSYAKRAGEQSTAGSLFGPNLTADQLLEGAVARYGKAANASAGQPAYATSSRGVDGGRGYQEGGFVPGAGGQGASGGSGSQGSAPGARILEQPPSSLTPNFDAAAAERYAAMRGAHADRKNTYGSRVPGVGAVLAPGPTAGSFRMSDAAVPGAIFAKGADGAARVQAALKAGVSPPQIGDAAAHSLRSAASGDKGIIDPAAARRWRQQHAEAFQALTQAAPAIARRFDTAQTMAARLFDLQAKRATIEASNPNRSGAPAAGSPEAHVQAVRDFEASAARHFLGGADPARQVGSLLSSATAVPQMRGLAKLIADDPAARAGIQRAIVDHIFSRLQGNSQAGLTGIERLKSDQFQTFMKNAAPALREVMSSNQVDMLQAVAADLQQANRSIDGTRVAGGSDTTQKAALLAQNGGRTMLGWARDNLLTGGLTLAGYVKGGPIGGFLANKAGSILNSMKAAGIAHTDDLVKEAMLNPGLARVLLANVTEKTAPNVANAFASQLSRIAAARGAHVAASMSAAARQGN